MDESHGIGWAWWVLAWIGTALAVWALYRLLRGAPSKDRRTDDPP